MSKKSLTVLKFSLAIFYFIVLLFYINHTKYIVKQDKYDAFVKSILTNSSYNLNVSEDITETLASQVSGVFAFVPYSPRQVEIMFSGISYINDETKYLSMCDVSYIYEKNQIISYIVIIDFIFDRNDTLINANIKVFPD